MSLSNPQRNPYDLIGGEAGTRALVERFYAIMDDDPAFVGIRALHPPALNGSTEKLFMFLSGWLGGPPLYVQAHGHPMLRARHLPFEIASAERDQWMACMDRAMQECGVDKDVRDALYNSFFRTADHLRNRQD